MAVYDLNAPEFQPNKRRIGITFAPDCSIQLSDASLVLSVSDAGRIVTVAIRVTNLTIAPMDNNFRMLSFGNRYSAIDRRVLRSVSAG